jgi:iron uptake system EfeUOB component EfeO/EfeM
VLAGVGVAAPRQPATRSGCSHYPTPGTIAPANARVPAGILNKYAILRRPKRPSDRLNLNLVRASLDASGLIRSKIRYLGKAAYGGRVFLIPAQHLLAFPIAPLHCLAPGLRPLERELLPSLRREYANPALCVVIIHANSGSPTCGVASGTSEALLYTSGTAGFGLVPGGVKLVTVTYQTSPPVTVRVHENFFSIIDPKVTAPPCGVQWLASTGSVIRTPAGCSYIQAESQALYAYRVYVTNKFKQLQSQVQQLITAINSDNLLAAEAAWLPAHLTWLDLGQDDGAYGAFGNLGRSIDGTAAGYPDGTSDPNFTGFHRIEFDLWTNHNLTAAATDAQNLLTFVNQLIAIPLSSSSELPANKNGIAAWVLRPHEIIEDANRDTLTGEDEYGSGTALASLTADITADRTILGELAPVIDPVAPHLVGRASYEFQQLTNAINADYTTDGGWVAIADLPTAQRQQIDADVGLVLETLAPIPDLITSTGNNAPSA